MKKQRTVLEVLSPQVRAELLRLLFAAPQKEHYVRELMRMSGLRLSTVQDELRKLSALRLVTSRSNRYHRFYRANRNHSLFADLVHIVKNSEQASLISNSILYPTQSSGRRGGARNGAAAGFARDSGLQKVVCVVRSRSAFFCFNGNYFL